MTGVSLTLTKCTPRVLVTIDPCPCGFTRAFKCLSFNYFPGSLSWFMTSFESRGAHRCGEQWSARDMRFYTGSCLYGDKNPMPCVCRLYSDCLG
jgi:hypothetical protein